MSWAEVKKINSDLSVSLDRRLSEGVLRGSNGSVIFSYVYPQRVDEDIVKIQGKGFIHYVEMDNTASVFNGGSRASYNVNFSIDGAKLIDVNLEVPSTASNNSNISTKLILASNELRTYGSNTNYYFYITKNSEMNNKAPTSFSDIKNPNDASYIDLFNTNRIVSETGSVMKYHCPQLMMHPLYFNNEVCINVKLIDKAGNYLNAQQSATINYTLLE